MTSDRPIRHVYFPETGVLAVIQQMHDGSAVAVDLVGSDGMVGLAVYLGAVTFPLEAICEAPGTFLRMKAAEFRAEVARNAPLLKVLQGYTQAVLEIRAQVIGCNRFHAVEARAARWLLEMDDRVSQDEFTMTHEFLAMMLGVRRQTVSAVASDLSRRGLVVYRRGFIEIVDRVGLEGATCECYEVIRNEFARLVGPPSRAPVRLGQPRNRPSVPIRKCRPQRRPRSAAAAPTARNSARAMSVGSRTYRRGSRRSSSPWQKRTAVVTSRQHRPSAARPCLPRAATPLSRGQHCGEDEIACEDYRAGPTVQPRPRRARAIDAPVRAR